MDLAPKGPPSPHSGRNEKLAEIGRDLESLTDKQLDIIRGFIENCINKNLLDEIKYILMDKKGR